MFSPRGFVQKYQEKEFNTKNKPRSVKVKVKRSNTYIYESDESVRSALLEILLYIVFVVVTTIVANTSHNLYMFYFNQTLEKAFLKRTSQTHFGSEVTFEEMVTPADWWIYLETNFLDELHGELPEIDPDLPLPVGEEEKKVKREDKGEGGSEGENEHQNEEYKKRIKKQNDDGDDEVLKPEPELMIHPDAIEKLKQRGQAQRQFLRANALMGPPRLRQIRVKKGACQVHPAFRSYFEDCYPGYSEKVENRSKIYKQTYFFSKTRLRVNNIKGEVTTYHGAGYVKYLSYNRRHNRHIIETLKESEWIDSGTRLVVVEFVLFNLNAFMFNNVKIIAEILPVGGIVPSHQFQALKFHTLWTEGDLGLYIAAGIFYLMTVGYTIEEIRQLVKNGCKTYFTSVWNILDIIVLIFAYLSLAYTILHPLYLKDKLVEGKLHPYKFVNIDYICFWNLLFIDMMGILVFLVWIKIFKYISFNKTMLQFSTTLKRCAKDLFGFAVMFFIVFLAYAQLGMLIFGATHPDFREFGIAVITLMRMFLGDFEYNLIEEANHILGPIYFLTYVLFVFFILLNMFLAIINDTYGAVKSEVSKGHSNFGSYIAKCFKRIFPCCFRKRKSAEKSINTDAEENTTPSMLPSSTSGIVQRPSSSREQKRDTEVLREYFEELPESQQSIPNNDLKRLNNRIKLLEDVLEQLITNMDRILKKMEVKKNK